jgi:hypothetical protein
MNLVGGIWGHLAETQRKAAGTNAKHLMTA